MTKRSSAVTFQECETKGLTNVIFGVSIITGGVSCFCSDTVYPSVLKLILIKTDLISTQYVFSICGPSIGR